VCRAGLKHGRVCCCCIAINHTVLGDMLPHVTSTSWCSFLSCHVVIAARLRCLCLHASWLSLPTVTLLLTHVCHTVTALHTHCCSQAGPVSATRTSCSSRTPSLTGPLQSSCSGRHPQQQVEQQQQQVVLMSPSVLLVAPATGPKSRQEVGRQGSNGGPLQQQRAAQQHLQSRHLPGRLGQQQEQQQHRQRKQTKAQPPQALQGRGSCQQQRCGPRHPTEQQGQGRQVELQGGWA